MYQCNVINCFDYTTATKKNNYYAIFSFLISYCNSKFWIAEVRGKSQCHWQFYPIVVMLWTSPNFNCSDLEIVTWYQKTGNGIVFKVLKNIVKSPIMGTMTKGSCWIMLSEWGYQKIPVFPKSINMYVVVNLYFTPQ